MLPTLTFGEDLCEKIQSIGITRKQTSSYAYLLGLSQYHERLFGARGYSTNRVNHLKAQYNHIFWKMPLIPGVRPGLYKSDGAFLTCTVPNHDLMEQAWNFVHSGQGQPAPKHMLGHQKLA